MRAGQPGPVNGAAREPAAPADAAGGAGPSLKREVAPAAGRGRAGDRTLTSLPRAKNRVPEGAGEAGWRSRDASGGEAG